MIVPEYLSGEKSYEDWLDQFESIAEINHWNSEQKQGGWKFALLGGP